jgi:hypothetical protein
MNALGLTILQIGFVAGRDPLPPMGLQRDRFGGRMWSGRRPRASYSS